MSVLHCSVDFNKLNDDDNNFRVMITSLQKLQILRQKLIHHVYVN